MRSLTLVPTVPEVVAAAFREEFRSGRPAALMTTLPFGIQTAVELRPAPAGSRAADTFGFTRPDFPGAGVHGAWQLTVKAGADSAAVPGASPTFHGAAIQLRNGIDLSTGSPLGISVLGSPKGPSSAVEKMFNDEFGPTGAFPRVPVTRLDISGYGGSTFSDWSNPLAQFAQASKVQFSVMVGRTAWEFVKFASVLYPWGVKVTRSVTVERRPHGGVVRRDSGWQPASAGMFDFRWQKSDGTPQPSPYLFHPGLLRGLYRISGLRPVDAPSVSFQGNGREVEVAPFYFDAWVSIDGAQDVFATGLLGFLHLKPVGLPLAPNELRRLIELQSAIGGPVDCDLNVGGSGFRAHATRIEVDTADEAGGIRFVGAVRCAPTFTQSGAWAAVRLPGPANASAPQDASSVDGARGLPLVRSGALVIGSSPVQISGGGDYRFADPADLFQANPPFDYGFVQSSPAHAFLFRRPVVSPNVAELRSALAPCFADHFARLSSKGLFPPVADAIELPANALAVNPATGSFRLSTPVNLPAPRGPLNAGQTAGDRIRVFYDKAQLRTDIGESSWSVDFSGIEIWADMLGVERFAGTRMKVIASDRQRPQATELTTHFHPDFEDILAIIPGFGNRGVHGPYELASSNEDHEFKLELKVAKIIKLSQHVKLQFFYTMAVGLGQQEHTHAWRALLGTSVGGELEVKIPLGGAFFMVLGVELEVGVKDMIADGLPAERELKAKLLVGFGVGTEIGGFEAEAYLAIGAIIRVDEDGMAFGGLILLEGELEVTWIAKVGVHAELQGIFRDTKPPDEPPDQKACDYEGEIAVNIELFLILSIEFSVSYSNTKVL
jgi:hypothetical protein